jgi:hypothetical protein
VDDGCHNGIEMSPRGRPEDEGGHTRPLTTLLIDNGFTYWVGASVCYRHFARDCTARMTSFGDQIRGFEGSMRGEDYGFTIPWEGDARRMMLRYIRVYRFVAVALFIGIVSDKLLGQEIRGLMREVHAGSTCGDLEFSRERA